MKQRMKKTFLTGLSLFAMLVCSAQPIDGYKSLDPGNPIAFFGSYIVYQGKTITLGTKAFFIDRQFSDEAAAKYPFVFNSVNKASEHLTNGSESSPMVLYLAPNVYWIDDPDDPAIRIPKNGSAPYGLIIECEWLRFYGLTDNPENVVLACNRGQTIGAQGNFTMFRFSGQGTSSENITFGNYCNIDLLYPLKPELGRLKRASAIVQAQLISCNGDKIVARNTRFVSRLNLCPFVGGKRVLFDRCHFECTDDALCATGVYLNSTFDFYSSKPFFGTFGTGAVLLNCDIRSFTRGNQYFTKGGGQVAVVDTRFESKTMTNLGWRDVAPGDMRNYEYNVSLNGKPVIISNNNPEITVGMAHKPLLDAYCFDLGGKAFYNTYNLLCGNDDWDPMGIRNIVLEAENKSGKKYTMLPVQLVISPARVTIETKKNDVRLTVKVNRFGNFELKGEVVKWAVTQEYKSLVELRVSEDGNTCDVIPANTNDEPKQVIVTASTPSGLEAACVLTVAPSKLVAPKFSSLPEISNGKNGKLSVTYKLDMRFDDQSLVSWYRCIDGEGSHPIEVAVSRLNRPLLEYELSAGDAGYYIMAAVAPKHIRCDAGEVVNTVMKEPVSAEDIKSNNRVLCTDFKNISTKNQPEVLPGFWTLGTIEPVANNVPTVPGNERDAWSYGEGTDGAANTIGLLQARNARLLYTPVGKEFGDMKLSMTVAPYKTAGQGFSIANLYMDVLIKFDTKTMTGYGLRFIRTTKYSDAVDCVFVKYENGKIVEICKPVTTTCYRPTCNITVEVKGNRINAHAESPAEYYMAPDRPEVVREVNMETEFIPNKSGGFGIQYNGGSATMIKELKVEWE
jgi:hypothetical protein